MIGRQKDGKWVSYVDSKNLSDLYFSGNEAYKASEGVHYETPQFQGDTMVIPYTFSSESGRRIVTNGEFRFKWDEVAQWFGIEQVVY